MKKGYVSYLVALPILISAIYPCRTSFADSSENTDINSATSYSNMNVVNNFDIDEFKRTISESEEKFLAEKNYDEAKKFIQSESLILDDLSSSYIILQYKYLNDNTDMNSFYEMNKMGALIYEAENSLKSCINKLSAVDIYAKLKEDFKLSPSYSHDFINTQSSLINNYYSSSDYEKLADIYVDLVSCRNAEAANKSYDDYSQMLFKQVYNRDYTLSDIQNVDTQLQGFISLYEKINIDLTESYSCNSTLSAEETLKKFENTLSVLPESISSVYSNAKTNKLFSMVDNENGSNTSITSYLYKYHQPCTYIKYSKTEYDFSNLVNELGLYTALYYKENKNSYFGSNNTGNDFLLTIRDYIKLLYARDDCQNIMSEILQELKNAYVINSFEAYAYTETDLTVEKLSQKYYQINKSLGVSYPEGQTSDNSWVYTEVIYTAPFSMADNIVAALNVLEYYDIIKSGESGKAENILDSFLTSPVSQGMSELLKSNNMSWCFESKHIQSLTDKYKTYLSEIYLLNDTGIPGDTNNDGCVTIRDVVIIKKYILCDINMEKMIAKGYSIENADINNDKEINIFDLQRVCKILIE